MSECSIEFVRRVDSQFIARLKGDTDSMAAFIPALEDIHTFDRCKLDFKVIEIRRHLDRFNNLTVVVYVKGM